MSETEADALVTRHGPVLQITLNRPAQRNALTRAAGLLIAAALDDLDSDAALSVGIITGAGGNFCSGMDLRRFASGEVVALPGRGLGGLTQRPPAKPLIAAVEGYAVAGGFELVLACDIVVAGRSARFGLPEVRRGLAARGGGLFRLPRRMPWAIAAELILTGDLIDAERAADLGLANRVVSDGTALTEAMVLAGKIAANAPLAVMASKRVMTESASWPLQECFQRQSAMTDPVFASEDAREGALAFAEKRPPVWRGR
jgi:enoyl-CoA hydratase